MAAASLRVVVDTSAVDDAIRFFREHEETIVENDVLQDRLDELIETGKVAIVMTHNGVVRTEPSLQLIQLMADIDRASRAPW